MITVGLKYFGAFRDSEKTANITEICFDSPVTISQLKLALGKKINEKEGNKAVEKLVQDSAFASEQEVLCENYQIERDCMLLVLPPVCGG